MIKVDGAISEEGKTDEQGGEEAVATASTGSTMDVPSTLRTPPSRMRHR